MGDFKNIVGKFLVAALVIFSLFSYIIVTQSENEAVDPLRNEQRFNESLESLIVSIDESTAAAEEKYGVFASEEPKSGFGSIVLFGIVSVGKTFSSIVFGVFGAIIKLPLTVLGIPSTVYSLILTWLIILVIVAVWLLYKMGG